MDPYALGQLVVIVNIIALIVWLSGSRLTFV